MNRMHTTLLSALLALTVSGCSTPGFAVRVGAFAPRVSGEVALGDGGSGAPIDVDSELGLGERSTAPLLEAEVDGPFGCVSVSGFRNQADGRGAIGEGFGDIPAGTAVESSLDVANLRAAWTWDLVDLGPVTLAPGVGLDWFGIDTDVRSLTAISVREQVKVEAPVPMLFVRAAVDFDVVRAEVLAGGLAVDTGDLDGTFIDIDARLTVAPWETVEFFAGYRRIIVDATSVVDGEDFGTDVVLDGLHIGGALRF
ncbi:MAG: hypothetical protein O2865_07045 [Planctomycetota bacterium]|nr:hypothetical protein [Planctomycetota bacterium]MDA0932647.1 hypothetical protein [Planctomycetota bacterium]MDA1220802.1 hypothetical protein [Planctomycetota bacterium]